MHVAWVGAGVQLYRSEGYLAVRKVSYRWIPGTGCLPDGSGCGCRENDVKQGRD